MAVDLVGIAEIAKMGDISKQAVNNWRLRHDSFPRPLKTLQCGPVWDREQVTAWVRRFKNEDTHVVSLINLKAGVGKTTIAVAVAEMLAQEHQKHVLMIDLDPQTNATVSLISEDKWEEVDGKGQTIAQLFDDRLNPQNPPKFDIDKSIIRGVSTTCGGIPRLDLLPSSLQLIDLQHKIPLMALAENFTANPLEILRVALESVIDRYDYVIIDCPPSLGAVTKNGLRISTGYVIPTIPDIVSTWGIFQIVENVQCFANDMNRTLPALGIVATKVRASNLHGRVIEDLKAGRLRKFGGTADRQQPKLFANSIPQMTAPAWESEVEADICTLKGKYGDAYSSLSGLTKEIKEQCEIKKR